MPPRTKKERIFRHMARDKQDQIVVYSQASVWDEDLDVPEHVRISLENWDRWMKIKHGSDVKFEFSNKIKQWSEVLETTGRVVLR